MLKGSLSYVLVPRPCTCLLCLLTISIICHLQARSMLSAGFFCCLLATRVSGRYPYSFRSGHITSLPITA